MTIKDARKAAWNLYGPRMNFTEEELNELRISQDASTMNETDFKRKWNVQRSRTYGNPLIVDKPAVD